jgi:Ca-activated chloride channel family protein
MRKSRHIRVRRTKKTSAPQARRNAFADPHLWEYLISGQEKSSRAFHEKNRFAWIAAWTLAALAASGPSIKTQLPDTTARASGIDIAVAIDISPSMSVQDIVPNRLERAKLELRDFVNRLPHHAYSDRVALIAFSANAYITLPLTPDKEAFLHFTDLLDPGLVIKHGSNIARALLIARQTLEGAEQQSRAIILITDGESHNSAAALAEVNTLRTLGIPLFIVGVGTEAGGPVPDGKGHFMKIKDELVISRLERATLASLAQKTGGLYVDISSDDSEWRQLFTQLRKLKPAQYSHDTPEQHYQLFPWLIGISLPLFIWAFLWAGARPGTVALLTWAMVMPMIALPEQAHATPWAEQRALDALNENNYEKSTALYRGIKSFNGLMGLGASAYRQQQWEVALRAFQQALRNADSDTERAQASYNVGNALAKMNRLDEAARAYENALRWQNNYPRAAFNLSLINKENEFRARTRKTGDPKKTPDLDTATQAAKNYRGLQQQKTTTGNPAQDSEQASKTSQTREKMQALRDNSQELLSNRFSTADKFSGVLVVEDEKPW